MILSEGFIDVFFGRKGTFVFANEDLCVGGGYVYPQRNILTFAVSETSMFFILLIRKTEILFARKWK